MVDFSVINIEIGDILPTVSTSPVASVVEFPNQYVRVTFEGQNGCKFFQYLGPNMGWERVRVIR